jgi:hypothetical protein
MEKTRKKSVVSKPRRRPSAARPKAISCAADAPAPVVTAVASAPVVITAKSVLAKHAADLKSHFVPGLPHWAVLSLIWFGVLLSFGSVLGGARQVTAATYVPPTANPPGGNVPITIWNRMDSVGTQSVAAIDIDGGGPAEVSGVPTGKAIGVAVGTSALNLGPTTSGQNIYFGGAAYDQMHAGDTLMLLQTYKSGAWTDRLRVDRDGNVSASGCFGAKFVGVTATAYTGALNGTGSGYYDANAKCSATFGTSAHVCSSAEMIESLKCAIAGSPIKSVGFNGVDAWTQDGPPGYTAPANDCMGWQSDAGTSLGRMWRFNAVTGGQGFLTTCNQSIKFACCK